MVALVDSCGADPGDFWPKSGSWELRLPTTCLRVKAAAGRLMLDVLGALLGVRSKVGPKMTSSWLIALLPSSRWL